MWYSLIFLLSRASQVQDSFSTIDLACSMQFNKRTEKVISNINIYVFTAQTPCLVFGMSHILMHHSIIYGTLFIIESKIDDFNCFEYIILAHKSGSVSGFLKS